MNILITSYDLQPQFIGGDKRVSLILAKEWKSQGHSVAILCFCGTSPLKRNEVEGVEHLHFPDEKSLYSAQNINYFRNIVKERNIDVVLNQHAVIDDFVKICNSVRDLIKVISVLHFDVRHDEHILANDFFIRYRNGHSVKRYMIDLLRYAKYLCVDKAKSHMTLKRKYNLLVESSDCVALLSDRMQSDFRSYLERRQERNIIGINNPVVLSLQGNKSVAKKEKMVVWCGRLEYGQKRLDRMLRIWKKINSAHPGWQLKILGSGDWDYWKNMILKHDVKNAEVVGFCTLAEYYEKAAILCMTSTSEGFPMVLVEAQSYGCVPVAYESFLSLPDIITDGETGFSIKAFDEKEYIKKLSVLMDNFSLREQMAVNGLRSIEKFEAQKIADSWIGEFERLLKS